ncbi:MAG: ABC transporter permease [Actinomycetota bacterium]|nr:ABC transporter permease [Actinomycetota bacterium]
MPDPRADSPLSESLPDNSLYVESALEIRTDAIVAEVHGASGAPGDAVKRRLGFGFWLAIAWLVLMTFLAAFGPMLPLDDPTDFVGKSKESFSSDHWLGTDKLGRDLLSRTVSGTRISLIVGIAAVAGGLLVGGTIGLIAGFRRGWFERTSMAGGDILLSFPAVVLALAIVSFRGRDLWDIVLTLFILSVAPILRLTRANSLQWSQREFVQASRVLGAKDSTILRREVLPNVLMPMASLALVGVAIVIVAEGTLAFLGLGIQTAFGVDDPISWGKMVLEGSKDLETAPHIAFVPATALFLTVLALNFAGDKIRGHFDVRESSL